MLASVLERTRELGMMRAVGASRGQVFCLLALEAVLLTVSGCLAGLVLTLLAGHLVEEVVKQFVPLAPSGSLLFLSGGIVLECFAVGIGIGLIASVYPAWQASRLRPTHALRTE